MFARFGTFDGRDQWSDIVNQHLGGVIHELGLTAENTGVRVGRIDLDETKTNFVITADVPGFTSDDVDIVLEGRKLRMKTQASESSSDATVKTLLRERTNGAMDRTVILPKAVDESGIHASVKAGILRIVLPKRADVTPKQIVVH